MRMKRSMVRSVTLSDYPLPSHLTTRWPEAMACAQVEVEPTDRPSTMDLRWLIDVPLVWVESFDRHRLDGLCAAVSAAGAKRVIGVHLKHGRHEVEVAAMTDTTGAAKWPS